MVHHIAKEIEETMVQLEGHRKSSEMRNRMKDT
jgi:hypothetical protein